MSVLLINFYHQNIILINQKNRIDKDEYFILDETQEDYADEIKHLITHLKYLNRQETKKKNVLELMNIN
jgi:hypothetical protein